MNKIYFDWQQIQKCCQAIVDVINHENWKPSAVVGLSRGGLVPAVNISHSLDIPLHSWNVTLRDHKSFHQHDVSFLLQPNLLVVDDINDTGATFDYCKRYLDLLTLNNNTAKFASCVENVSSNFKSDWYGSTIDKKQDPSWIVFPWEKP